MTAPSSLLAVWQELRADWSAREPVLSKMGELGRAGWSEWAAEGDAFGLDLPYPTWSKAVVADLVKVGPKGYIHGWIYVGPAKLTHPFEVHHPELGTGKVTRRGSKTIGVQFQSGYHAFEHKPETPDAAEHFVTRPGHGAWTGPEERARRDAHTAALEAGGSVARVARAREAATHSWSGNPHSAMRPMEALTDGDWRSMSDEDKTSVREALARLQGPRRSQPGDEIHTRAGALAARLADKPKVRRGTSTPRTAPLPTPPNPQSAWGRERDNPNLMWSATNGRPGYGDQIDRVYTAPNATEARQFLETRDSEQLYQIAQGGNVDTRGLDEKRDRAAYIEAIIDGVREPDSAAPGGPKSWAQRKQEHDTRLAAAQAEFDQAQAAESGHYDSMRAAHGQDASQWPHGTPEHAALSAAARQRNEANSKLQDALAYSREDAEQIAEETPKAKALLDRAKANGWLTHVSPAGPQGGEPPGIRIELADPKSNNQYQVYFTLGKRGQKFNGGLMAEPSKGRGGWRNGTLKQIHAAVHGEDAPAGPAAAPAVEAAAPEVHVPPAPPVPAAPRIPEPSPERRAQLDRVIADYAPRYRQFGTMNLGTSDTARYLVEGHIKDATSDEWDWLAQHLADNPRLREGVPLTDAEIALRNKTQADELSTRAFAAFDSGDPHEALRLIDQAQQIDPRNRTDWTGPGNRWDVIRNAIHERMDAATAAEPAAVPAPTVPVSHLKAGDYAKVTGEDEYGKPTTLTGYVSNPTPVRIGRRGRKTKRDAVAVQVTETPSGANGWRGAVYVAPDAHATPMTAPNAAAAEPAHEPLVRSDISPVGDARGAGLVPGDTVTVGSRRHNRTDETATVLDVGASRVGGHDLATVRFADGTTDQILAGNLVRSGSAESTYLTNPQPRTRRRSAIHAAPAEQAGHVRGAAYAGRGAAWPRV
jgi:hypothetical protein